jgi:hypothetical protein
MQVLLKILYFSPKKDDFGLEFGSRTCENGKTTRVSHKKLLVKFLSFWQQFLSFLMARPAAFFTAGHYCETLF